ncbi:hypothetical protein FJT64_015094 [Amphibalanus amphitrite]|uniref:MARVEL domain-containing protein n=1 Tax=Amphibalanus amphitrite TaxID=1232801 RepID=A0A6A4XDK6_AMPAM|nr:uncharacterized protein LOC122379696 [Amphibalanus amphitrite]KAF0314440.1 hypothetical protein FJT64_015094 [Amphibalanus amphitrite]
MAHQSSCCFGRVSLRTGSIIIGVALVTASAAGAVGFLCALLYLLLETPQEAPLTLEAVGALLVLSVLHLVFSSLLVHGVRRARRSLLLTWLIFCAILVILQTMAIVVAASLAGMKGTTGAHCSVLAIGGTWTALLAYCFMIVLYHSLELNALATKQLNSGAAKAKAKVAAAGGGRSGKEVPVQVV